MPDFPYTIRPYQLEGIKQLNELFRQGNTRPILCLPTGAGKTVTFAYMLYLATQKGLSAWVVVDRKELKKQAEDTINQFGLSGKVEVYMVETLCRRNYPAPDIIIIDECHVGNFRKLITRYPNTRMVGVTATPLSSSKKNPLNQVFDSITCPVQIIDLINDDYLCNATYRFPELSDSDFDGLQVSKSNGDYTEKSLNEVYGKRVLVDALDYAYSEAGHQKSIVFAPSIEMTQTIADRYNAIALHSKMSETERDYNVARFRASADSWLINCGIATRGFDVSDIRNVIVYRKTTSLALWLQMCGRGSRRHPGKEKFTIWDFGQNVDNHGLWEMDRDWVAIFKQKPQTKKKKELGMSPEKQCVSCRSFIPASASVCSFCGAKQPVNGPITANGVTDEIMFGEIPDRLKKPYSEMTVEELIERAKYGSKGLGRPYKKSWVVAQIKSSGDTQKLRYYAKLMGYKSGWLYRQMETIY